MLYVQDKLPKKEWMISNIALGDIFPNELSLDLIPYYF